MPEALDAAACISTTAELMIWEDVGQELEDFIYLARLGCMDEALRLYNSKLKAYEYKHFPIILEYIEVRRTRLSGDPLAMLPEDLEEIERLCNGDLSLRFQASEERTFM